MPDPLAVAVPQTSFAGGAALPVHASLLEALGLVPEPLLVPPDDPLPQLAAQARALHDIVASAGGPAIVTAECSLAGAAVAGARERFPDVNLVWLDAHADINTPRTSESGLLVGMALAAAIGSCLPELLGDTPPARVALVGTRAFDDPERRLIEALDLLEASSAAEVTRRLPSGPVHVHLDGDVFNPADEPHAPYPEPGGPSALELRHFLTELSGARDVIGVSICGYAAADGAVSPAYELALDPLLTRW